ncbi:cyclic-di-AMP receptor [Clostridium paraputrificum]|uniref:cyclic-di-AMP receptor n=1 Tax=Clostridium TaxID=1485 RepID=UPI003D32BFA7
MKMVIAIVQDDDALDLLDALTEKNFRVTKLATTGGFLKAGNTTLMIGVEKEKTEEVVNIIKDICKKRTEVVPSTTPFSGNTGIYMQSSMEVEVGGANIFVIDVDQFIRI